MAQLLGVTQPTQPAEQSNFLTDLFKQAREKVAEVTGANVPYKYANPVTNPLDLRTTIGPSPDQPQLKPDEPGMKAGPDAVTSNVAFFQALMQHLTDLGAGIGVAGVVGRRGKIGPTTERPAEPYKPVRPVLEEAVNEGYRNADNTTLRPGEDPIRASRPKVYERFLRNLPGQSGPVTPPVTEPATTAAQPTPATRIGPVSTPVTEPVRVPVEVKPNEHPALTKLANEYNASAGLPPVKHEAFKVNEDLSKRIGAFYDKAESNERDPEVVAAYKKFMSGGDVYDKLKFAPQKAFVLPEEMRHPEGKTATQTQVHPAATNSLLKTDVTQKVEPGMLNRSGFIDDAGNAIQLKGVDHLYALTKAGLAGQYTPGVVNKQMEGLLEQYRLTRVYVDRNSFHPNLTIEMAHKPSEALMHTIDMLARANPRAGVVFDIHNNGTRTSSVQGGNTLEAFKEAVGKVYGTGHNTDKK